MVRLAAFASNHRRHLPESGAALAAAYRWCTRAFAAGLCVLAVACNDGDGAPPTAEGLPAATAPVITQHPANLTVVSGQPASFTVAANGTPPLAYQWQRNGADIAGATGATYVIASAAGSDSGVLFRAVVSNAAGGVNSNNATLTVTAAAPVLTITQQPVDANVAADMGAQFRAMLTCSGQSATTSNLATLTVAQPSAVTLLYPREKTRDPARITPTAIVREPAGSCAFVNNNMIKRLSADQLSITYVTGGTGTGTGTADGGLGVAEFNNPKGLTIDAAGNVYDASGQIRVIDTTTAAVTTFAGTPNNQRPGYVDGLPGHAFLDNVQQDGITPTGDGGLMIGDRRALRITDAAGRVRSIATDAFNFSGGTTETTTTGVLASGPHGRWLHAHRLRLEPLLCLPHVIGALFGQPQARLTASLYT